MKRFVEGVARDQGGLFPAHLDDFVAEDNPVRAVDAFVEMLDPRALGFDAVDAAATGRPAALARPSSASSASATARGAKVTQESSSGACVIGSP